MPHWLDKLNRLLAKGLWWVVLAGVLGSLPVLAARVQTERSADQVEVAVDYRDLLQVASTQADPQSYLADRLAQLKEAGVNAMVVYESTLEELVWAQEIAVYDASGAALLQGKAKQPGDNGTYVLFLNPEHASVYRPIIETAFRNAGADVTDWSADGRSGLRIGMGPDDASLRPMQPSPVEMQALKDAGFLVVPRLSDRIEPFNEEEMNRWLDSFKSLGVTRVVFDGDAVTGYADQAESKSLSRFAAQLKARGIGIALFENLKVPQKGQGTLAKLLDYNVVRAHPVSEAEMARLDPDVLADRLLLAVKDRNIRFIFLNASASKDPVKGKVVEPLDTIVKALKGDPDTGTSGVVQGWKHFGFTVGEAQAFAVHHAPLEALWRALAVAGAVALTALAVGLFLPSWLTPVTALGVIGGAGVIATQSGLLTQALALLAAIASPTLSVALLIRRLRQPEAVVGRTVPAGLRLARAIGLYARTAVLSVAAVPLVAALLNHITYSLVLQQFRGVSLLHLAPVALVAAYFFLYAPGGTVWSNLKRLLAQPVTLLWIVIGVVLAGAGYYYLTRTGNSGQASGFELMLRNTLENTFGVRPRFKEFLMAHPLLLVALFLSLRYRWPRFLLIFATIGQLSMVDTFAHLHTPLLLSVARILLGLVLGLIIGLVGVAVWQIGETVWRRSRPRTAR